MPYDSLGGPMTNLSGQDRVLVNLSPRQAKEQDLLINAISGQRGIGSLDSVALMSSLGNRLQQLCRGSMLYRETCKQKRTLSGLQFWAHIASVPRTFDNDCISALPTPTARDWRYGMSQTLLLKRKSHPRGVNLNEFMQRQLGHSGMLNPVFVCLLQGYPVEWDVCGVTAMQSSHKSRQRLFKRT